MTVPSETLERFLAGERLSESEQKMIASHPDIARNLIENIPRLEVIAEMIANQNRPLDKVKDPEELRNNRALMGASILKTAIDFDTLLSGGATPGSATEDLKKRRGGYNPSILKILPNIKVPTFETTIKSQKVNQLANGTVLAEDVRTKSGVLVVTKGQEVNDVLRRRLENFSLQGNIEETVRVHVAQQAV